MSDGERTDRVLLVGLWISLSCHAFCVMGFVRYGPELLSPRPIGSVERPSPKAESEEPHLSKPHVIQLGLAKSEANTLAWLGFQEATEHSAPLGRVDQSQMTIKQAGPQARPELAAGGQPTPQASPSQPSPATPDLLQEPKQRQAADAAAAMAELRLRASQLAQELVTASPNPGKPETGDPTPSSTTAQSPAPSKPNPVAPQTDPSTPKPNSPVPPSVAPGEGGGMAGIQANKESVAVAIKKAATVRPGQVASAQGLDIQTRVPRWTITTLMTLRPRNPTVLITFRKDGTVKNVEFARDGTTEYSTGHEAWDQPLLNAIYGWTATGKPLSELESSDADAGLTIMMTVLLPR